QQHVADVGVVLDDQDPETGFAPDRFHGRDLQRRAVGQPGQCRVADVRADGGVPRGLDAPGRVGNAGAGLHCAQAGKDAAPPLRLASPQFGPNSQVVLPGRAPPVRSTTRLPPVGQQHPAARVSPVWVSVALPPLFCSLSAMVPLTDTSWLPSSVNVWSPWYIR